MTDTCALGEYIVKLAYPSSKITSDCNSQVKDKDSAKLWQVTLQWCVYSLLAASELWYDFDTFCTCTCENHYCPSFITRSLPDWYYANVPSVRHLMERPLRQKRPGFQFIKREDFLWNSIAFSRTCR